MHPGRFYIFRTAHLVNERIISTRGCMFEDLQRITLFTLKGLDLLRPINEYINFKKSTYFAC